MEGEVWWVGGLRRQAAEGTGGRERQAQEAAGGGDARQRDAQGRRLKKMVTPAGKREAVAHLRTSFEVSERVCSVGSGPHVGSLPQQSCRRWSRAGASARAGGYPPAVRLSPPACAVAPRGCRHEPQEAASALSRGAAAGPPSCWAQTGARHQGADGDPAGAEPALESRLPVGRLHRRPPLPHPGRCR
jgi:hypothetical protein